MSVFDNQNNFAYQIDISEGNIRKINNFNRKLITFNNMNIE